MPTVSAGQRVAAGAIPDLRPSLDSERTTLITGALKLNRTPLYTNLLFFIFLSHKNYVVACVVKVLFVSKWISFHAMIYLNFLVFGFSTCG